MKSIQEDFLKLLSGYQGIIHKVNLAYFRSDADRQDNFQEITYQLWRSFPALKNRDKPASWIYAVAIHTSISKIRKERPLDFCESVPDVAAVEPDEDDGNVNYQRLVEALHNLNEIDKSVMLLYLEDFSYEEIAKIVGISVPNAGVKIHRLKIQLQKQLNKQTK